MPLALDEVVRQMMEEGWKPNPPASTAQIASVERQFGVTFPRDYREFLGISNGGGKRPPYSFRGLMQLEEIKLFNSTYRVQTNFPGLVAFANEGFLVYAFDFRADEIVVASVGLSSSDWSDVVTEAETFSEWLEAGIPR